MTHADISGIWPANLPLTMFSNTRRYPALSSERFFLQKTFTPDVTLCTTTLSSCCKLGRVSFNSNIESFRRHVCNLDLSMIITEMVSYTSWMIVGMLECGRWLRNLLIFSISKSKTISEGSSTQITLESIKKLSLIDPFRKSQSKV